MARRRLACLRNRANAMIVVTRTGVPVGRFRVMGAVRLDVLWKKTGKLPERLPRIVRIWVVNLNRGAGTCGLGSNGFALESAMIRGT